MSTSVAAPVRPSERTLRDVFWLMLGREITPVELRNELRVFEPSQLGGLAGRVLASGEFRVYYRDRLNRAPILDLEALEAGLASIGSDQRFVDRMYELMLGRPADATGRAGYLAALAGGTARAEAVRAVLASEEFADRYAQVVPEGGVIPCDTQLCELANPAKWDNPEWLLFLRELHVGRADKFSMHRKCYEFTQLLFGLSRLGRLRDDVKVLSVGAGHEPVLYALANRVGLVVATDLYEGAWQTVQAAEGDARVLSDPSAYAPFPYRTERLAFLKMDALALGLGTGAFDVAYSLSSVEHFGGLAGAKRAIDEMARTLKPGGILALATEYLLSGPPHDEVFRPAEIHDLFDRPDLRLVEPIDESVYARYTYKAIDLYGNPYQTPHMVVRWNDTVFTTVMAFLEKR